jgi:hypothetical protein
MNIGKLYQVKEYYWLLYPSTDIAVAVAHADITNPYTVPSCAAEGWSDYWSNQLNCNVSFIPQNSMFMLLEQTDKVCKILTTNGEIGWIIYPEDAEWTKGCIEEVKHVYVYS